MQGEKLSHSIRKSSVDRGEEMEERRRKGKTCIPTDRQVSAERAMHGLTGGPKGALNMRMRDKNHPFHFIADFCYPPESQQLLYRTPRSTVPGPGSQFPSENGGGRLRPFTEIGQYPSPHLRHHCRRFFSLSLKLCLISSSQLLDWDTFRALGLILIKIRFQQFGFNRK